MMPKLPARAADDLGLRGALSDRLLPLLVAAMVFLAALAGAGGIAAARLAGNWRDATDGAIVQVTAPDAAVALLGPTAHRLTQAELAGALKPWLGEDAGKLAVTLPAVFTLPGNPPPKLEQALARAAPGALVSRNTVWQDRLAALAHTLQVSAALTACVVAFVAAGVVALATGAGLAARRDIIETIHHLGATDGRIAGSFASRASGLAFTGAVFGVLLAAFVLLALAHVTAPFQPPVAAVPAASTQLEGLDTLPPSVWALLAALPLLAALIGWLTAQATVRSWLGQLP